MPPLLAAPRQILMILYPDLGLEAGHHVSRTTYYPDDNLG